MLLLLLVCLLLSSASVAEESGQKVKRELPPAPSSGFRTARNGTLDSFDLFCAK